MRPAAWPLSHDSDRTGAGPALETCFDLLLWRGALGDAPSGPSGSDLADWARRLSDAGETAAAALLFDVAALHQGFSPQAIASRRGNAFANTLSAHSSPSSGDWTLHRAAAELRELARRAAVVGCPRLSLPPVPRPSGRPDNPAGIGEGAPKPVMSDVAATARELRAALETDAPDGEKLASLLESVVEAYHRYSAFDFKTFAQAPLGLLVTAIATTGLIDFVLSTRDLWHAPLGSPALFHHAARLDSAGLGPYLGNVGRIARFARDVVDLARIAQDLAVKAGDAGATIPAWFVLLSRGCRGGLLCEIVDDLGDSAEHDALMAILDRVTSCRDWAIDTSMVGRLRDAGLDNVDYVLAARAQRVIVRLRPDDRLESIILGSIEASGGEFAQAEAIFRQWLARAPDDKDVLERLLAVQRDRFDGFVIGQGFGSPPDRRDARLRRRGVTPEYPRRRGERIHAVDVG